MSAQIDFIGGTTHLYRSVVMPENEMLGVQYCCAERLLLSEHWLVNVIRRAEMIRMLASPELLDYFRAHSRDV